MASLSARESSAPVNINFAAYINRSFTVTLRLLATLRHLSGEMDLRRNPWRNRKA